MSDVKAATYEAVRGARAWLNNLLDAKWDNDPFGAAPLAPREEYERLFAEARQKTHPGVEAIEHELGFAVDRAWLDQLALHTQITKKNSELTYAHGRLLYSLLRRYIADSAEQFFSVIETGTARGFSAICMAKALEDAGVEGRIVTLDVLPHLKPQIWNCIDDHEGKKSRAELLAPWADLVRRVIFLQGDTLSLLPKVGLDRVNFAFLDAQHIRTSVLAEFATIAPRQRSGDIIFFDDVTPAVFPGVVAALESIEARGDYDVRRLTLSETRGYAWARRF